jgi:hypothetical protein
LSRIITSALSAVAPVLLVLDPDGNLPTALALLGLAAVALYGTALVRSWGFGRSSRMNGASLPLAGRGVRLVRPRTASRCCTFLESGEIVLCVCFLDGLYFP